MMNEFDIKAAAWDLNPMHFARSEAVTKQITGIIPVSKSMSVLEFGAGTGITGFMLREYVKDITMMDNSPEMVKRIEAKIAEADAPNLHAIFYDLENNEWTGKKFDLLVTQMVLHHIADINKITGKFFKILNPGGFLAIADLCPEDGSFHGEGFTGHPGFNPAELSQVIENQGFHNTSWDKCFTFSKKTGDSVTRSYDMFLLTARRPLTD